MLTNIISPFVIYIAAFFVLRFGLILLAARIFAADIILNPPVTTHLTAWYAGSTVFVVLTVLGLAGWGAYTALGCQQLWEVQAFE